VQRTVKPFRSFAEAEKADSDAGAKIRPPTSNAISDPAAYHTSNRADNTVQNSRDQSNRVYMTALDGWVHDRFSTAWMQHGEALFAIVCTLFALLFLERSKLLKQGAD
jgi:hypothetical protein